jgi:hypothetical protein
MQSLLNFLLTRNEYVVCRENQLFLKRSDLTIDINIIVLCTARVSYALS